jgi:stress-induced morphogen
MTTAVITEEFVREKCTTSPDLEATHVECEIEGDGCDGGVKITLLVVSSKFDSLSLIKRHKLVNSIFANELKTGQIHALTIKAKTPAQFDASTTE